MWDIYQVSLTGENALYVTFPVIIGFDDLLPFQNFGDFPSCVLGYFKLNIRVSLDALLWCSVNTQESIRQLAEVSSQKIMIMKYLIINNLQMLSLQHDSKIITIIDLHKSTHLVELQLIAFLTLSG
jgi:hypothetical protein